ncbi:MAG: TIGR03085 family protein [Micromonosporaceae bacterium]|nr:TIGR03085 family protein [Micromonosporaceae bacterium]
MRATVGRTYLNKVAVPLRNVSSVTINIYRVASPDSAPLEGTPKPGHRENYARTNRAALCDLLVELGPDQPTLCTGWTTRDLAAHLVVRERRPDAAAGILIKGLSGYRKRVEQRMAARPFEKVVAKLRRPPLLSLSGIGPLDRMANTLEMFIHLEDVRRAQPTWQPRPLPRGLGEALWRATRVNARLTLRRFKAAVVLAAPEYGEVRVGAGDALVRVSGDPGELAIFMTGRQRAARVEVTGPEELVDKLRNKRLGV